MLDEIAVDCPYCGERFTALIDAGDTGWVQDCEVCCHPIVFHLHTDPAGGQPRVTTERENDA